MATTTIAATTATIEGLTGGTAYSYVVESLSGSGVGDVSAVAIQSTSPATPLDLSSTVQTSTSISLSWSASVVQTNGEAVTIYRVYQNDGAGGSLPSTATWESTDGTATSTAMTVDPGKLYEFAVSAVSAAGEGELSSDGDSDGGEEGVDWLAGDPAWGSAALEDEWRAASLARQAVGDAAYAAAHAAGASRAEACDAAVRAVRLDEVEAQSSFLVRAGWYGSGRDGGGEGAGATAARNRRRRGATARAQEGARGPGPRRGRSPAWPVLRCPRSTPGMRLGPGNGADASWRTSCGRSDSSKGKKGSKGCGKGKGCSSKGKGRRGAAKGRSSQGGRVRVEGGRRRRRGRLCVRRMRRRSSAGRSRLLHARSCRWRRRHARQPCWRLSQLHLCRALELCWAR